MSNLASRPSLDDFECPLCLKLLFDPTTSPCGHSFCRSCAYELIEASSTTTVTNITGLRCPLCRTPIDHRRWKPTTTIALARLLASTFVDEYAERAQHAMPLPPTPLCSNNDDYTNNNHDPLPLFVMEPLLPGQRMYLHVFEMRYRLLIQHAMQHFRSQFGMVMRPGSFHRHDHNDGGAGTSHVADHGTLVEILSCNSLPDGRFHVTIQGRSIFRIVDQTAVVSRYGYWQAQVIPVNVDAHDDEVSNHEEPAVVENQAAALNDSNTHTATEPAETDAITANNSDASSTSSRNDCQELSQQVREQYDNWAKLLVENNWEHHPQHLHRVLEILGPQPSTPGRLAVWVAAAMNPLPPLGVAREIRPAILAATTCRQRLQIIKDALDESVQFIQHKRGTVSVWGMARVYVWVVYSVIFALGLVVWGCLQASAQGVVLQQFQMNDEGLLGVFGLYAKLLVSGDASQEATNQRTVEL